MLLFHRTGLRRRDQVNIRVVHQRVEQFYGRLIDQPIRSFGAPAAIAACRDIAAVDLPL